MGCGSGGGGSTNTVTQNSTPPDYVSNAYKALLSRGTNTANLPLNQYSGATVAGFTPDQTTAMNTVNQSQGVATPFANAGAQYATAGAQGVYPQLQQFNSQNLQQYLDPNTQNVINTTMQQANQNDQLQQQQLLGSAISSGASPFGGDRAGVAAATLAGQQALANNQTIAGLNSQNYTQALNELNNQQQLQANTQASDDWRQLSAAQLLPQIGTTAQNNILQGASSQLQSGGLQQQLQQEQLDVPYENYLAQQAYPFQTTNFLAGLTEGIGSGSGGTGSTTSPGPSTGSQLAGLGLTGLALNQSLPAGMGLISALGALKSGGVIPHRANGGSNIPIPQIGANNQVYYMGGDSPSQGVAPPSNVNLKPTLVSHTISPPTSSSIPSNLTSDYTAPMIGPTAAYPNAPVPKTPATTATSSPTPSNPNNLPQRLLSLINSNSAWRKSLGMSHGGVAPQHFAIGGVTLPQVPDVSVSIVPSPSSMKAGNGPPQPPSPFQDKTTSPLGDLKGGADLGKMFSGLSDSGGSLFSNLTNATTGSGSALADSGISFPFKIGGVAPHYDDGGSVRITSSDADLQMQNPMTQAYFKQYSGLPMEKLQQLVTMNPGNVMAQKVLQMKKMGNTGMAPTAQGATQGVAPNEPFYGGYATGGVMPHFDDGGYLSDSPSEQVLQDIATEDNGNANVHSGGIDIPSVSASDLQPPPDAKGVAPPVETRNVSAPLPTPQTGELDNKPIVDHSGDTVKVHYPSESKSVDTGIPSMKDQGLTSSPWFPLLAAGLGIMGGTSPHALTNIGQGGLQGLKAGEQAREAALKENQAQNESQKLASDLDYRNQELTLRREALEQGKFQVTPFGDVINTKTGKRVMNPALGGSANIDPTTGDITPPSFGFDLSNIPTKVYNQMATEDSKRRQADISNLPIASNVLRILDQMEPNLKNFTTGSWMPQTRAAANRLFGTDAGTAAANIEKGSNDLATELNKFEYMPGMRSSVLGLQTILASKPGINQPEQTNENMINSLRAKVTDYALTGELAQQYREKSPLKITDQNAYKLDNALKTIYPIEQVDPKTGNTIFNKQNAQTIRQTIPDAIANPKKYLDLASKGASADTQSSGTSNQSLPTITSPNDPAFQSLPKGSSFMTQDGRTMIKN